MVWVSCSQCGGKGEHQHGAFSVVCTGCTGLKGRFEEETTPSPQPRRITEEERRLAEKWELLREYSLDDWERDPPEEMEAL